MEQRRFLTFAIFSLAVVFIWQSFVVPRFFPAKPQAKKQAEKKDDAEKKPASVEAVDKAPPETEKPAEKPDEKPAELKPVKHERKIVELGSINPESGYRMNAVLTSRGAAVQEIQLNDPRYRELIAQPGKPPDNKKVHPPLRVVGNGAATAMTLQTAMPQFGVDLNKWDWEVVSTTPAEAPHEQVVFRMTSPDGQLEVLKTYRVAKVDLKLELPEGPAYELHMDLTVRNRGENSRKLNYELQGPIGLPLENVENTPKFRDVAVGFLNEDGSISAQLLDAKSIASDKSEEWKRPLKYIGVDAQYFCALVLPGGDQIKSPYIKSSTQVVTEKANANELQRSDISVVLTSVDLEIPGVEKPGGAPGEVAHSYRLFAGPKREELVTHVGAPTVVTYGFFSIISRPMLLLLKLFYALFHNYGVAIICLTVIVRACMFPLSIKQARGAAKMQEIQPEMAAIKEKYGKDPEKFRKAYAELFAKHNYHPLSGCLPALVQLPIFMGLYNALYYAVDLRMASFLWVENLAAPDALFQLPFRIPLTGWTEFNLLPIISTVLLLIQQKMFMPPPMSEEQAMQQKMMNLIMPPMMGILFYRVPAGLCVYFVVSSLWGMTERKLLPKVTKHPPPPPATVSTARTEPRTPSGNGSESEGFFSKLLKAAEKEASAKRRK